jgi:hypothetical protein
VVLVCKWQETSIRQVKSSPPPPRLSKHPPILLHLLLLSSFTSFSCSADSRLLHILLLLLRFFSFERSQTLVLLSVFFQRKHNVLALLSSYQSSFRCWFYAPSYFSPPCPPPLPSRSLRRYPLRCRNPNGTSTEIAASNWNTACFACR